MRLPLSPLALALRGAVAADRRLCRRRGHSGGSKVKVDDHSFKCITDMTKVRHFYVDNLLGNVAGTVAVAKADKGDYPPGSVLQLMPNEATSTSTPTRTARRSSPAALPR
jgi:hypothetical protein